MTTKSSIDRDPKFNTHDQRLLCLWDEIQHIQTDFCFAQEISAYYMSYNWIHNVSSVLDIGTGNGYFLSRLQERFPNKDYIGIDISQELIDLAKSNLRSFHTQLRVQDYFTITGVYDFVIMRLFWQHLPSSRINEALNKLAEITKPGSSVLISDSYDKVRCFLPALPEFQKVIAAYTHQQSAVERNRDILATIIDWAQTTASWRVDCDLPLILPSSIPGYLSLYHRIYELWIELFACLGELDMDFTPARKELACWREDESAYTQAGLRIVRMDRIA